MNISCPLLNKNESSADRIIRIGIGMIALVAGLYWFTGTVQTISFVVSAIALITGVTGFCGLYALLGISTKRRIK